MNYNTPPPPPPPPQTKFWVGYIGITLSVPMSACLFTPCPGHNFLPSYPIWIIFHTIVVHYPRVCHDLDSRSYLQGQGHSAHILKILVRVKLLTAMLDLGNISHNCCPWPKGVSWPWPWSWPKVISPRSRSQCIYTENPCPSSSLPCWIWIIFHTLIVHDPSLCHDLDLRSYIKCQGHSEHIPNIHVRATTPHCHVGSG